MVPTLERVSARLLTAGGGGSHHRLFVVGHAVLEPPADRHVAWLVRVTTDGTFLPKPAALAPAGGGRIAAALLEPRDLPLVGRQLCEALTAPPAPCRRREFYGWSLLYQLAGDVGFGRIDRADGPGDLPAFYESPLEVADRQEHLARRGIPSRALALLTQRSDFDAAVSPPRNRLTPAAKWNRAVIFER